LCDNRTKLWLEGGYYFGAPVSPKVPPLLSRPNISSVFPDLVVPQQGDGIKLPAAVAGWGKSFAICYVDGTKQGECLKNRINAVGETFKIGTGLYALYVDSAGDPQASPSALLLVTPGGSDLTNKWDAIAEEFRMSRSAAVVQSPQWIHGATVSVTLRLTPAYEAVMVLAL